MILLLPNTIVCNYMFCHELSVFPTRMTLHEDRDCVLFTAAPSAPKTAWRLVGAQQIEKDKQVGSKAARHALALWACRGRSSPAPKARPASLSRVGACATQFF